MFTKEIKLEAREMLKKDDNLYFPGIWLFLIPYLVLGIGMEKLFKGGITNFIIGIVCIIILGFFCCWLVSWIVNLIYSKKTITRSIPRFKILVPYVILFAVQLIIMQGINAMKDNFYKPIILLITFIITCLVTMFIQIMVIDSTRNNGEIQWVRILKTTIRAIPKVIIFELSFIPLYLLIVITFCILTFWKITYIETSYILLLSKIYDENNDIPRLDKNDNGNQNRYSSDMMYTENSRFN